VERLLTPQQVAEQLAVSVKRIHALCREGKLAYVVVDGRGKRRFTPEQIDAFTAAETVPIPMPVDKKPRQPLPSAAKGGDRKSVGVSARAQLREEMRSWR